MILLLSPAKSLDYERRLPAAHLRRMTTPLFTDQAAQLVTLLQQQTPAQFAALMDLSPALTALNVARHRAWVAQPAPGPARPAVLAFDGDVYDGLDARSLSTADLVWAQERVVMLSGLYGVLRPFDALQPYRLEMGSALANPQGRDLYAFWGDTVTAHLNERLAADNKPVVINLASQEYARVALRPSLNARVIDCRFEDETDQGFKVVSFFAKRARGLMARWVVQQRLRAPTRLKAFALDGYAHVPHASSPDHLVFRRLKRAPAGQNTLA